MTANMTYRQLSPIAADQKAFQEERADKLYAQAAYVSPWQQLVEWLRGQNRGLFDLNTVVGSRQIDAGRTEAAVVSLSDIRGSSSTGRTSDFDHHFRPRHPALQRRWTSLAAARRLGRVIPPVNLVKLVGLPGFADIYFVEDGHHRVSVAKALGDEVINAVVSTWHVTPDANSQAVDSRTQPGLV